MPQGAAAGPACREWRKRRDNSAKEAVHAGAGGRIGRARARAVLGARRQPAADQAVVRAGQPRHRRGGRMRADRRARYRRAGGLRRRTTRSTWSSRARRRRWSPASPMRWKPPASPAAARPRAAARLEGSKTFAKEICDAAGIPTAHWERFDDADAAREFVRRRGAPIVVKADGLAAGKGVVVAATEAEALAAIDAIMDRPHLRRGRRGGGDRGMPERRGSLACSRCATARTRCRSAPRRTTSGWATAIPAPTPAAWAPTAPVAGVPARGGAGGDGADHPPGAGRTWRARGTPFRGVLFAGLMLTADGAEADRVQRPLRRPGMPGAAAAAEIRSAARAAGRPRRASSPTSTCAGATTPRSPW